ncbi:Hypothetical protein PBC10988_24550 [Planctomycetales bacterium 10988]|nr:Hypothetical protein PBC10988_24550 [Planctomycetales bacterium 10988]
MKTTVRENLKSLRRIAEPGDPDYVERTISNFRRARSQFAGVSEVDLKLARMQCHARLAIHEKDKAAFSQAIKEGSSLLKELDPGQRCLGLLTLGMLCAEFDEGKQAKKYYKEMFDLLFKLVEMDAKMVLSGISLGISFNNPFGSIAKVTDDAELLQIGKQLEKIPSPSELYMPFSMGVTEAGKIEIAETLYQQVQSDHSKILIATGVLEGLATREDQSQDQPTKSQFSEQEQQKALAEIDQIIAEKSQLDFVTKGKKRPKRNFLGPYNVPRSSLPDYEGKIWTEKEGLPELTNQEFYQVQMEIVSALGKHGSVYGKTSLESGQDFFVWEDKFFDRTITVEIEPSDYLAEILPAAVAEVQTTLAQRPTWRVKVLGHGKKTKAQYFVIYPDAIRIKQLSEADSMTEAIEANAKLRSASN